MADQVAIVTGASRGIGFAIAQRFVAEGWKVAITGRNAEALEQARATTPTTGPPWSTPCSASSGR
jgi:NAD(P)-dependent dehydrogenase (short-subunit alcohol dehydrogenase family)